jgi:hypothetical protein
MKIIKKGMRLWITTASVFSFLAGWVFFAHSNKPAPLQASQPAVTTTTNTLSSQSFSRNTQTGLFPFAGQNQINSFSPRLRTGGS